MSNLSFTHDNSEKNEKSIDLADHGEQTGLTLDKYYRIMNPWTNSSS